MRRPVDDSATTIAFRFTLAPSTPAGLYTMKQMATITADRLIASFTYPANAQQWIPDRGDGEIADAMRGC